MNAREQRLLAQENWREAQSRQLAQRAFEALGHRAHDEAIQLAVLAWRLGRTDQARDAMRRVVGSAGGVTTVLGEHTPGIATLAFTPDSQGLVSVARDGSMMIWAYDARGWRLAGKLLELPRSANALREDEVRVQAIGFGSRGRHLLAWHRNGNAWWWDLDAGSSQRIETGLLDGQTLWHAAVSPRGDWVVFSSDEWLSSWALPAGPALRASMPAGQRVTLAACFVDDTTVRVLVGNRQSDETVRLLEWDLATHRLSAGPTVLRPQQQYVRAPGLQATFSHDWGQSYFSCRLTR